MSTELTSQPGSLHRSIAMCFPSIPQPRTTTLLMSASLLLNRAQGRSKRTRREVLVRHGAHGGVHVGPFQNAVRVALDMLIERQRLTGRQERHRLVHPIQKCPTLKSLLKGESGLTGLPKLSLSIPGRRCSTQSHGDKVALA